jgi:lysozyme
LWSEIVTDPALTIAAPFIAGFEGFRANPYQDITGVWTIGYGTTVLPDGSRVTAQTPSVDQATALGYLENYLRGSLKYIDVVVISPLNPNQAAALLSFCYNLGDGALGESTLLRLLNSGDYQGAAGQFKLWDHAGGVAVPGLLRRRLAEAELFLKPWSIK